MNKKFLIEKKTLTGLTKWLNTWATKISGVEFTTNDVQKYISRGYLPEYLGKNTIIQDRTIADVKLYNVLKTNNDE